MRTVRIPADVDREDRLMGGLTARQLAWLSAGVVVLVGLWSATHALLPAPVFAAGATPVAAVALALALGRRDGLAADRLALAWVRHVRAARRLVPAPEGVPTLPVWAGRRELPAPLPFPVVDVGEGGLVNLGEDGLVVVCRASSINFGLRTAAEQEGLVAALGRWLNALDAPVQIVVRAERVDLDQAVASLRQAAPGLPHPALEEAARDHARFLADLAARRDVLRRVVLLVFRHTHEPDGDEMLRRRVEESARALAVAGVSLTVLSEDDVLAILAAAAGNPATRPPGLARPAEVVRRAA